MNIAFQALAIFALALPGIILKNSYRRGFFWNRPRQAVPIGEEIAYSLVLAGVLHAVYGTLVNRFVWPIDLQATAVLLLGQFGKDSLGLAPAVSALTAHPLRILFYFAGLYAASGALGLFAHWLVRRFELDINYPAFRFDHQWHYLLRGEIGRFPESSITIEGEIDAIIVACVVVTPPATFLYVGVLDSFYFNRAGELDLLVLTGAMRRPIDPAREREPRDPAEYFFIDAEYLYLKYTEVKNIGLRYIRTIEGTA